VTSVHAPPALLAQLDPAAVPGLRRLVLDGPAPVAADLARAAAPAGVDVLIEYGSAPTGWAALVGTADEPARARPHRNCHVLVLDAQRRLLPVGAVGEVYVAGPGLARGYLNQPQRSAERFVPYPFRPDPGQPDPQRGPADGGPRLYRTGRLARWRADGVLEFVDRRPASTGAPSRAPGRRGPSHRSARRVRANPPPPSERG
jgi:non-ribosomal peptide synthetase component F